jgi:hypothetical protein
MNDDPLKPPDLPLDDSPRLSPDALDRLLGEVEAQVARRGPLDRLRAWSTPSRVLVTVLPALLLGLWLVLTGHAADPAEAALIRRICTPTVLSCLLLLAFWTRDRAMWTQRSLLSMLFNLMIPFVLLKDTWFILSAETPPSMGEAWQLRTPIGAALLTVLAAAAAADLLRPMHLRPRRLGPALLAAPLGLGLLIGLQPDELWHIDAPAALHSHCLEVATLVGTLTTGLALLFAREDVRRAPERVIAAGALGGAAGFFVVHLTCPVNTLSHVLIGHASSGPLIAAALGLLAWGSLALERRGARPA